MANNGNLSGGRALTRWMQQDAVQGSVVQRIIDAVNNLGRSVGASPIGQLSAPAPPQGLNIKAVNGTVHATITDASPIGKPLHYFLEYDTSPAFTQPHVLHNGTSRSIPPFTLPAKNDAGDAQPWHFRAYSSYQGSLASDKVTFGGASGATPVNVGGALNMTLLPSTGAGTASPNGTQGGQGFGNVAARPAQGPKRSVGSGQ